MTQEEHNCLHLIGGCKCKGRRISVYIVTRLVTMSSWIKLIKQKCRLETVQTMGHMFPSGIKMYEGEQNNLKPMWLLMYSGCSTFCPLPCETRGHRLVADCAFIINRSTRKARKSIVKPLPNPWHHGFRLYLCHITSPISTTQMITLSIQTLTPSHRRCLKMDGCGLLGTLIGGC